MSELMNLAHLDMLKEVIGEDLKEILETFIKNAPIDVQAIEIAMTQKQADVLRLQAHSLKGSAANVGAESLSQLCKTLEELAQAEEMESAVSIVNQIKEVLSSVLTFLNQYIKQI